MRALAVVVLLFGALWTEALGASPMVHDADGAPEERVVPPLADGLAISFIRVRNSTAFDAIVTSADNTPLPDGVVVTASRADVGTPRRVGAALRARLTPRGSGYVTVTASAGQRRARRVALVLGFVDERWNQPEPVAGLVNTLGWEDGASISDDGQTLSLQYLPVSISCLFGGDPNDAQACRVRGPVSGPDRPDMPGAERVTGESYLNGCPSLGAPSLPFPAPPNSVYAFMRGRTAPLHRRGRGLWPAPMGVCPCSAPNCRKTTPR